MNMKADVVENSEGLAKATFGAGCFWCVEAVFERIPGVIKVKPGYAGGHLKNPTYQQVASGDTGCAEVVQITYDPKRVSYPALLDVFFRSHDPTTLNRQGNDVGSQYRSVIFYTNDKEKQEALEVIRKLNEKDVQQKPIVTQLEPLDHFYPAENYHRNYYDKHPNAPYCTYVIRPKLKKLNLE